MKSKINTLLKTVISRRELVRFGVLFNYTVAASYVMDIIIRTDKQINNYYNYIKVFFFI